MEMAAITHRGNVRENNEDAYYIDVTDGKLLAVADGMGGHKAGEVASKMAIEKVLEVFKMNRVDSEQIVSAILKTFEEASAEIDAKSNEDENYEGMGTTLTLAYLENGVLYIGHIGDSRAYLVDSKGIRRVTQDHTLVSELVRKGTISEKEAKNHPQRNVIMKALGSGCKGLPEIKEIEISEPTVAVICSDGLTDLVSDEEIQKEISAHRDHLAEALVALKDIALHRGGIDNVTIVAASIPLA